MVVPSAEIKKQGGTDSEQRGVGLEKAEKMRKSEHETPQSRVAWWRRVADN